jgi:hypothetical protein
MSNPSKDRSSLCSFTFADGRQCRMLRHGNHPYLCAFHARKEAQALAGAQAAEDIAYHLSGSFISACDLSSALGRLFSAVAQGQIKPKVAATLSYLSQSLVQTIHLSQHEYINAFGTNTWRETIRISHDDSAKRLSLAAEAAEADPVKTPAPLASTVTK